MKLAEMPVLRRKMTQAAATDPGLPDRILASAPPPTACPEDLVASASASASVSGAPSPVQLGLAVASRAPMGLETDVRPHRRSMGARLVYEINP
ncbi:hypothetical protein PG993_004238 [Apiospora rasikravindrae]|uniref:Uncharacterized protein n=1 Tax=Apiospora rasikravindrae TaxID=990691 RepID=A0ABR1TC68_9PEZI